MENEYKVYFEVLLKEKDKIIRTQALDRFDLKSYSNRGNFYFVIYILFFGQAIGSVLLMVDTVHIQHLWNFIGWAIFVIFDLLVVFPFLIKISSNNIKVHRFLKKYEYYFRTKLEERNLATEKIQGI